jgi:multidrug resistance protein, MATE family
VTLLETLSFLPALRREAIALWKLAWPILVGQVAMIGMAVSDTVMTGRMSTGDLAAVSLGVATWTVATLTLIGLLMPVNALVAHEYGAGRHDQVGQTARQALWLALAGGLVGMLVVNLAASQFSALPLRPEVAEMATRFVLWISPSLPALALYRALYAYSAGIGRTKPMMTIALAALGYNVLANWVFIYGHWGMPQLGGLGCALATASGLWLMLGAMALWVRHAQAYRSTCPLRQLQRPDRAQIATMLRLGAPLGLAYFAEVSAFSIIAFLVTPFGEAEVAANQIAMNVMSVVFVVPLSFGIALVTRVGQALGSGDPARARFVAWSGIGVAIVAGAVSTAGIALFRHDIAGLYTTDPVVQLATAGLLLLAALFQIADATQVVAASAIRGYKETRKPMVIHLTAFWCVALPAGYVLGDGLLARVVPGFSAAPLGAAGYWMGLVLGLSVAAVLLLRLLASLSRGRLEPAAVGMALRPATQA